MRKIINLYNRNTVYSKEELTRICEALHCSTVHKRRYENDSFSYQGNTVIHNPSINQNEEYNPTLFINKYVNNQIIKNAIQANPEICKILTSNGLVPKISDTNINNQAKRHLLLTCKNAREIAKNIHLDNTNTKILMKAALLHDIGKALIPEEIIQKPGKLTDKEREIINLHSQLSYEILKTTDITSEILEAIKLHHTSVENCEKSKNIVANILSVADVYSALKEKRAYKDEMNDNEIFAIMTKMPTLDQKLVKILFISKSI